MRTGKCRFAFWMRASAWALSAAMLATTVLSEPAYAWQTSRAARLAQPMWDRRQMLTPEQWAKVDARRARDAAAMSRKPDVRALSTAEMRSLRGSGPYRNAALGGTLPWHRSLRDANLCTGNVYKSFTDIQVPPAKGAGLLAQRTYNSVDPTIGPYGIGWTDAYATNMTEEPPAVSPGQDDALNNMVDRKDFFGGRHKYHRDADGLYSPPPYLYYEMSSQYNSFLVNGPPDVAADTDKAMDGTVKHFIKNGSERDCDTITDRYGNQTVLVYADVTSNGATRHLLSTVTDPSSRQLAYRWYNFGSAQAPVWRITQIDGPQYSVVYTYGADYNLSSVDLDATNPGMGAAQTVTGPAPHQDRATSFTYTSATGVNGTENGLLASVTDPLGHVLRYSYTVDFRDPSGGQSLGTPTGTVWASSITEPAGVDGGGVARTQTWTILSVWSTGGPNPPMHTQFTTGQLFTADGNNYTGLGYVLVADTKLRKTGLMADILKSGVWTNRYDSANNVVAAIDNSASSPEQSREDDYTYGSFGNVLTHSIAGFAGADTATYYDASSYFAKKSVTDMNGHTSTFIVGDNQGNDPTGGQPTSNGNRGSVLYARDAGYSVVGSPNYHKQFAYTYLVTGQKASETNENGVVTNFSYGDQWGNLTQAVQDPGSGHLNRTTALTMDAAGRCVAATDPMGLQTTTAYSNLGQPTTVVNPAKMNGQQVVTPAETVQYVYDANGRPRSVTDSRGTTTLTYEAGCDRVSSVTDPVTGAIGYAYGVSGERATLTLPGGGIWSYAYSAGTTPDRMLAKDDPNSLSLVPVSMTDDQGRRVDVTYLHNGGISCIGRLQSVTSNQSFDINQSLLSYQQSDYAYDSAAGGSVNSHNWPTEIKQTWHYKDGNGVWQSRVLVQNDYTLDPTGQRLTNAVSDASGPVRTEHYGYDVVNRLTSVDYGDGQTQGYQFDAMGNRTQKQDSVSGTEGYTVNAANMLLTRGTNSYANDLDGNTLTGGGRTNTWDSQNRLVQCVANGNTCSYVYGADGLRRRSTVNSTTTDYVLDSSMMVRERRGASNLATYFIGVRGPEYRRDDTSGQVRWYVFDGLGSVVGEVDTNGNITSSRKFDVYGAVRGGVNPGGTSRQKFVGSLGHTSDDETGIVYMQARYMDPVTGCFISEDAAKNGVNWFSYCGGSPVSYVDRTGKRCEVVGDVFALAGAALAILACTMQDKEKALVAASMATVCFGIAALGFDASVPLGYAIAILGAVQGLGFGAIQLILEKTRYDALMPSLATPAVIACCMEALLICGMICSVGVDAGG